MFFFYTFSPLFPHYFYTFFLSFSFFCNTYFSSTIFLVTNSKTFVGVTLSVVFLTPFMADNYADEKRCFLDCFGVFLQQKKRKEIIEVHCFNDVVFLVFFFTFNFFEGLFMLLFLDYLWGTCYSCCRWKYRKNRKGKNVICN